MINFATTNEITTTTSAATALNACFGFHLAQI